jgi:hypothetical protein
MAHEMARVDLEAEGLLAKATPIEEQCPRCPQVFLVQLSFMCSHDPEVVPKGMPASAPTHMPICPGCLYQHLVGEVPLDWQKNTATEVTLTFKRPENARRNRAEE